MKSQHQDQVIGFPIFYKVASIAKRPALDYLPESDGNYNNSSATSRSNEGKADSVIRRMNKLGKKADNLAIGLREHVRLAPKITESVKGKLSLGAKILQVGGVQKVFRHLFAVNKDEKLLKASQCYLSTTAGPIAGLLFISTSKVAFCSERSIKLSSPNGKCIRVHYKALIPIAKIKRVGQSENVKKPSEKYMEIVTVDDFEFWFMGFLNYQKTFKHLQKVISHD